MKETISRRHFLQRSSAVYIASAATGTVLLNAAIDLPAQTLQTNRNQERGPRLNLEMVNEFVAVAHGDLGKVKKLLTQEPKLINSAWDWGGGDWETALGAASHTGNKAIALFLLEKGARMDLFAAAMLGKLNIIKAAIEAFPENRNVTGPHGITLLEHAKAGKEDAADVAKYLESLNQNR